VVAVHVGAHRVGDPAGAQGVDPGAEAIGGGRAGERD
jgi:hypothetical protein